MRLWLVRHAEVQAPAGLCYGRSDLPAQAEATARAAAQLASHLPQSVALHVSPLQRCEQLAQALCGLRPDLALNFDPRLREMDFGRWEGRPWAGIARTEFDAWMHDFTDARPGGDGESVRELMARVGQAWDAHRARAGEGVWITHAGVMRAAQLLARGMRLPVRATDWPAEPIAFGAAIAIDPPA